MIRLLRDRFCNFRMRLAECDPIGQDAAVGRKFMLRRSVRLWFRFLIPELQGPGLGDA